MSYNISRHISYFSQLEDEGIGYDFYNADGLQIRVYDNGKSYVWAHDGKGRTLHFEQNNTVKEHKRKILDSKQAVQAQIKRLTKDLDRLQDTLEKYNKLNE